MNVLEEAASRLSVDVDALVASSLVRGRRMRRRRQVLAGVGSVAAVSALAVGGVVVGQSFGSHPVAVPADGPSPSVSASPTLPPHAELAPASVVVARLKAAMPAGVTVMGLKADPDPISVDPGGAAKEPGYLIHFTVNGAAVGIAIDWPSAGRVEHGMSVLPPDSECKGSHPMPASCHAMPDGSWIETFDERPEGGVGTPASEVENYVGYWRTDGWRVYASALNSTQEKGDGTAVLPHPPLTVEQLQQIATSGIWFQ